MSDVLSGSENTLPMQVDRVGFMLDRLGQDCSPLQYVRELTQNSIEAIGRTSEKSGQIVWDVDWPLYDLNGVTKLSLTDTGDGMSGPDMVRYINALSSSVSIQALDGNFGVGAKIAAATRNHAGLLYQSWRDGKGSMIHLWRSASGEYGLRQFSIGDDRFGHWVPIEDAVRPDLITEHGTKVILLGNDDEADTMAPPAGAAGPSRWVARYLNTRYFRFPEGVTVKAREGWEHPREDKDRNLLRTVTGQEKYLEDHAQSSGSVEITDGTARWWILKDEPALTQNSGFVNSAGHAAALYQNELYETVTARSAAARLQLFGVIFGYNRVVIYVEPRCDGEQRVQSNTARTSLILDGEPLPWADWAAEFRGQMPAEIKELMDEVTAGSMSSDHRQAIRERLKSIRDLFQLSRYRLNRRGSVTVDATSLQGGEPGGEGTSRRGSSGGGQRGGRAGNIYALFIAHEGEPADPISSTAEPEVKWISVKDGTRLTDFLEDRAAKYLPDQHLLQINQDFRVFTDMMERWQKQYPAAATGVVEDVVKEWFEQSLIETILGLTSLRDSQEWSASQLAQAWSEEGLTSAVMPRYHIDVAIKRALGSKMGQVNKAG